MSKINLRRKADSSKVSRDEVDGGKSRVTYFVIFCEEDDSYSLVPDKDVVCEPNIKVGEEVQFFFGRSKPYCGPVSGLSENFEEMKALQHKLNSQNKLKAASFHCEKPRVAATKCKEQFKHHQIRGRNCKDHTKDRNCEMSVEDRGDQSSRNVLDSALKSDIESLRDEPTVKKTKLDVKDVFSESDDTENSEVDDDLSKELSITDENDSAESDVPLSAEELALLSKLSQRKKFAQLKVLHSLPKPSSEIGNLNGNNRVTSRTAKQRTKEQKQFDSHKKNMKMDMTVNKDKNLSLTTSNILDKFQEPAANPASNFVDLFGEDSSDLVSKSPGKECSNPPSENFLSPTDSTSGTKDASAPSNAPPKASSLPESPPLSRGWSRYKPRYDKRVFNGEYFQHKKDDPDVVKLNSAYEVYILEKDKLDVKKKQEQAQKLFECLYRLFLQRKLGHSAPQRAGQQQAREGLCHIEAPLSGHGIDAIHAFLMGKNEKRGWKQISRTDVVRTIGDVLNTARYTARLKEEYERHKAAVAAAAALDQNPSDELTLLS